MDNDELLMGQALQEAEQALQEGQIPVGAVLVCNGQVIAAAHNRRENDLDPTAHAEILALRRAARQLGRWRLNGCTLYVTLQPCPMCAAALSAARISRCVWGQSDPAAGCCGSVYDLLCDPQLNPSPAAWRGHVREDECAAMLKTFFQTARADVVERQTPGT